MGASIEIIRDGLPRDHETGDSHKFTITITRQDGCAPDMDEMYTALRMAADSIHPMQSVHTHGFGDWVWRLNHLARKWWQT